MVWVAAVCAYATGAAAANASATAAVKWIFDTASLLYRRLTFCQQPRRARVPGRRRVDFQWNPELIITGDDFHKDCNRGRSANGHPPIEGTKGNRRARHARVQAWGAQNQPRQKGQEPQTGDRDRAARGGRLQIREQGEEPPEPNAY